MLHRNLDNYASQKRQVYTHYKEQERQGMGKRYLQSSSFDFNRTIHVNIWTAARAAST